MDQLEKKLIEKAVAGDAGAFESLILKYERKIYAIGFKVFKNEQDAYDVAQEICIKVYRKLDQFNFDSSFSTWLYRLATNTAIDEYRKQKRRMSHETSADKQLDSDESTVKMEIRDSSDTPEQAVLRKESIEMVWEALAGLKEDQKTIIVMKDIEGKSYDEIGTELDIGLGTVKSRLARARTALKKVLMENREQILF